MGDEDVESDNSAYILSDDERDAKALAMTKAKRAEARKIANARHKPDKNPPHNHFLHYSNPLHLCFQDWKDQKLICNWCLEEVVG
jgi:hypothetical protein